ncbi:hypothetical protein Hanom_Chr05g00423361 [Helianthus anomalus]
MKKIEETPKEKSRALAVIQDDEGFDWSEFCRMKTQSVLCLCQLQQSQHTTERDLWHKE